MIILNGGVRVNVIYSVKLNVSEKNVFKSLILKQKDSNSRFIDCAFMHGRFMLLIRAGEVVLNVTRADGQHRSFAGTINDNGTVRIPVANWMVENAGMIDCDVSVFDGDEKLTSALFSAEVQASANPDGSVAPDDPAVDMAMVLIDRAEAAAAEAKSYARGGTGVRDGENIDNAKYYKELAEQALQGQIIDPTFSAWLTAHMSEFLAEVGDKADDWLAENITNPSNPPLDTSLSLSNAAAPANLVGDLKSALDYYTQDLNFTDYAVRKKLGNHYIADNGLPSSSASANWQLFKFNINGAQKVTISTGKKSSTSSTVVRLYSFFSLDYADVTASNYMTVLASDKLISTGDSYAQGDNQWITKNVDVPDGAKVLVVACATYYINNDEYPSVLNQILTPAQSKQYIDRMAEFPAYITLYSGGYSSSGSYSENNARGCTKKIKLDDYTLYADDGFEFAVNYYSADDAHISGSNIPFTANPLSVLGDAPDNAVWFAITARRSGNTDISNELDNVANHIHLVSTAKKYFNKYVAETLKEFGVLDFGILRGRYTVSRTGLIGPSTKAVASRWITGLAGKHFHVRCNKNWVYTVAEYTAADTSTFVKTAYFESTSDEVHITCPYVVFGFKRRGTDGSFEDIELSDFDHSVVFFEQEATARHDIPENIGVLNAILNAKQAKEITYTPIEILPCRNNSGVADYPANTPITGMVYSSTRIENFFVPHNVSYHTFMTALTNPNAYIYTEKLDVSPYNQPNARCFYGTVCSMFVGHNIGLKPNWTTMTWTDIPGMNLVANRSAYGVKLGDTLLTDGHVKMITDIVRDSRGRIQSIEVMDSFRPVIRRTIYTADEFDTMLYRAAEPYQIYRYDYIWKAKYVQSPYVTVEDEYPLPAEEYPTNIMGRYGDKFNVRAGSDVVFDVLDAESYTQYKVKKDGNVIATETIPNNGVITLTNVAYGTYEIYLTDGTNDSVPCKFIAIDCNVTVTFTSPSVTTFAFSSENATPLWCAWGSKSYVTRHIYELTDEDIENGTVTVTYYNELTFKRKVFFETEYGILGSEWASDPSAGPNGYEDADTDPDVD